jgi:tetratricopeptide (TPR) repeat protein
VLLLLWRLMVMPAIVAAIGVFFGHHLTRWTLVNIALYPVILAVSIALHELGHVAVARTAGLNVPRVVVGIGRLWRRWCWGKTTVVLNAFPLGGHTVIAPDREEGALWRCWLSVFAGPAVTAAVAAIAFWWPEPLTVGEILAPMRAVNGQLAVRELVGFANAWLFILNVIPFALTRPTIGVANDGTQLTTLPFSTAAQIRDLAIVGTLMDVIERWEREDHQGAKQLIEEALRRVPESVAARNALGLALMNEERLHEARALFLALLAEHPPKGEFRWILRNNIAWIDFRIRDRDLRPEADEHSAAVAQRHAEAGWALGTRGAVLLWRGNYTEAVRVLERAYVMNSDDADRASYACCLAMALAYLTRTAEAKAWLLRAEQTHSRCPLLAEARGIVDVISKANAARNCCLTGIAASPVRSARDQGCVQLQQARRHRVIKPQCLPTANDWTLCVSRRSAAASRSATTRPGSGLPCLPTPTATSRPRSTQCRLAGSGRRGPARSPPFLPRDQASSCVRPRNRTVRLAARGCRHRTPEAAQRSPFVPRGIHVN